MLGRRKQGISNERMTDKYPKVPLDYKVGEALQYFQSNAEEGKFETLNYLYILDGGKLVGVISIKELFQADPDRAVSEVMCGELITATKKTSSKRIGVLAARNSIKQVPVLDPDGNIVGVVTSDEVARILYEELSSDFLHMGGISGAKVHHEFTLRSILESYGVRIPWLLIGLVGGLLTAGIVTGFEEILSQNIILASFIPVMVYISGAVGVQMEAFIIRDLSTKQSMRFTQYFFWHLLVVTLLAVTIGLSIGTATLLLFGNARISWVLSLTMFVAMVTSVFTGLIIPYVFDKMKLDPADASGPIATVIQDAFTVFIYFVIAAALL